MLNFYHQMVCHLDFVALSMKASWPVSVHLVPQSGQTLQGLLFFGRQLSQSSEMSCGVFSLPFKN